MTHAAVLFHLPRLSPRKCLRGERRELHGWPARPWGAPRPRPGGTHSWGRLRERDGRGRAGPGGVTGRRGLCAEKQGVSLV